MLEPPHDLHPLKALTHRRNPAPFRDVDVHPALSVWTYQMHGSVATPGNATGIEVRFARPAEFRPEALQVSQGVFPEALLALFVVRKSVVAVLTGAAVITQQHLS